MKGLILFLLSSTLFASEDLSPCRFDLAGKSFPHSSFLEKKPMSSTDCEKLAKKTLEENQQNYLRAVIHDQVSGKLKVIDLKGENK